MNLFSTGDRRSFEESQSYVGECAGLGGSRSEVFSPYEGKVRTRGAEGNAIALVVRTHAGEVVAARYLALEMEYTRWLHTWSRRLVVASVSIQPGDREGVFAPIRWRTPYLRGLGVCPLRKEERCSPEGGVTDSPSQESTPADFRLCRWFFSFRYVHLALPCDWHRDGIAARRVYIPS